MKFVSKIAAFIAALAVTSVAMAQFTSQKNANQVGDGDTSIAIENVKGKPGAAIFKTSGLKLVVVSDEKAPDGYKPELLKKPDASDPSKTVDIGTFADNQSLAQHTLCWRGVGRKGWGQMSCSKVGVNGSARHQMVTDARGEVMAFTPELRNAKGEHVSWVSHPAEVRRQLHCDGKSQQASVFFIEANGNWRPATLEETVKYDQEEYAKACKEKFGNPPHNISPCDLK